MLETDEVDVDLFTANPGTSLATIFSTGQGEQANDNTSLKYIPQVPTKPLQPAHENIDNKTKPESPTNCIFATVVIGYEWINNTYNVRKNLSLAIIKIKKKNIHQIILYNSEKKILSLASISPVFVVNVKKDVSFSYYDNYRKYWLICSAGSKINKIIDCLEELNVNINYTTDKKNLPENMSDNVDGEIQTKDITESDTDSSRVKDKGTILKRMASMGHSVLPSNDVNTQSSDSTNEEEKTHHHKHPRHKFTKSVSKNTKPEKPVVPSRGNNLDLYKEQPNTSILSKSCGLPFKQEIALADTASTTAPSFVVNSNCDMNGFITEQRINNAELRINFNRMTDKLEQLLLLKTKDTEFNKTQSSINQTIVGKLLNVYETKINTYENFFRSKGFDCNLLIPTSDKKDQQSIDDNEQRDIKELKLLGEVKDREIERLTKELQAITKSETSLADKTQTNESSLSDDILELKKAVNEKNEVIKKLDDNIQHIMTILDKSNLSNKVKKIMNGTYQTIASNFDDEVNYSGAQVKTIVGNVIKNSTLEFLHDIDNDTSNR